MVFRYLETGYGTAAFNMGLDEAVLHSVATGVAAPTLRLYAWKPRAVSIGYFQGLHEEVDVRACSERGVDVVRRITGGGAVFHAAELTYSLVVPIGHPVVAGDILASYRSICAGVVAGCAALGVAAEFVPLNDIVSGGKKISGNAQTRKQGCVLQHGTVILSVDVDEMFMLLKVPSEKMKGKLIEDVKARVTSLSDATGKSLGFDDVVPAFRDGFASALGVDLEPGTPTVAELALAAQLGAEKFGSPDWTAKR
jgi:lipoate-protein ligase A